MALAYGEAGPKLPDICDVLRYLESESVMLNALKGYILERDQRENALITRLEEVERRMEEIEGQSARDERDEKDELVDEPAPAFNVEEAEWAPLPESDDDDAGNWLAEAELAPLPEDNDEEEEGNVEVPVESMEISDAVEPEETFRELVLRSRTIKMPVTASQNILVRAQSEEFHPADVGKLPEKLRNELKAPQAEPYLIAREDEDVKIVCGICNRQFDSIKGWRIHASKLHKQDGFCTRCGHYLLTPPGYTATQKAAAVEIHVLDWCPRASAAVLKERQTKRRRLELVGRMDSAEYFFI